MAYIPKSQQHAIEHGAIAAFPTGARDVEQGCCPRGIRTVVLSSSTASVNVLMVSLMRNLRAIE
jgi:hypothetical protein